jgi:hypothetical protein
LEENRKREKIQLFWEVEKITIIEGKSVETRKSRRKKIASPESALLHNEMGGIKKVVIFEIATPVNGEIVSKEE